jgi:hypothetical protein
MSKNRLPEDIKPQWLAVIRRLQSVSSNGTLTMVSVTVLVDQDGIPQLWLEPRTRKIEPQMKSQEILALLTQVSRDDPDA